jgi:hypothetical protein
LNQNSFTGAEWAVKKDEIACLAELSDAHTESVHLVGCSNLHS